MSATITVLGSVGNDPTLSHHPNDLAIAKFRLASTTRRFDKGEQKWVDADTTWYTVTAFRSLAEHVAASVVKGQPVIVTGRLKVEQWTKEQRSGTSFEIEAELVGHDLRWGTAAFTRPVSRARDAGESDPPNGVDGVPEQNSSGWAAVPVGAGAGVAAEVPF
ncbi:MAG: single-stranded DNA-binding protein [Micrococcales bacterium]|nr:single-stranded DNA-binding protein [Micrococcales bacterium]